MERIFKSPHHKAMFELAQVRRDKVKEERAKGRTWTDIGKEMGITPQRCLQLGKVKSA